MSHQHAAEDIVEGPTTLSKVAIHQGMRLALREENTQIKLVSSKTTHCCNDYEWMQSVFGEVL